MVIHPIKMGGRSKTRSFFRYNVSNVVWVNFFFFGLKSLCGYTKVMAWAVTNCREHEAIK